MAAATLREMYARDPRPKRVIDVARGLEGLRRQDGSTLQRSSSPMSP